MVSIWDEVYSRLAAYDVSTGRLLWDKHFGTTVETLAINSMADQVAGTFDVLLCQQPHLQRWELRTGKDLPPLENRSPDLSNLISEPSNAVIYNRDGNRILAVNLGEIRAWDSQSGKNVFTITPPQFGDRGERIYSIALSVNGKYLAGAGDTAVLFWNALTHKYLRRFGRSEDSPAKHILLDPEGRALYVDPGNSAPIVFDTTSGKVIHTFGPKDYAASQLTPAGDFVIISPIDIRTWSPKTNQFSKPLARRTSQAFVLKNGEIWGFDSSGSIWERDPTKPRVLTLFNNTTGKEIQRFTLPGRYQ